MPVQVTEESFQYLRQQTDGYAPVQLVAKVVFALSRMPEVVNGEIELGPDSIPEIHKSMDELSKKSVGEIATLGRQITSEAFISKYKE